jgi:SpoIID/LytB domain protein
MDQINNCTAILQSTIDDVQKSITPLQKESTGLQAKISSAKNQIAAMENQVTKLGQQLIDKEADLEVQKTLFSERIRNYYINTKKYNPFLIFFASSESSLLLQQYTWSQAIIHQDQTSITTYVNDINTLNNDKIKLETAKTQISALKKSMDDRFGYLSKVITQAETYKNKLNDALTKLEAQRIANLNLPTTVGSGIACVDDRKIDPGFGSGFAFFTFGIPHHVGLNQYGAYGRAKAGQSYHDILSAYFNNISFDKRPNITIKVNGYGSMSLEQYLLGIYEVPNDWPMEALKAQAVAARSYALNYTNNGANSICTTQACQVYKGGDKGGAWEQAVKATEGEVLTQNGQVITAWFASTAGGFTYTSSDVGWASTGWTKEIRDTSGDVNSFDDLFSKAYDKDSPCFYAAQGYRPEYNKSAWLKPSEVADIINVVLLYQKDSSVQSHLCYKDNSGGCSDTWNSDRVKTELKNRGGNPFNSIDSASVTDWDKNGGRTNTISFTGDVGSVSLSGSIFKSLFNIRAPANISIVGPLYNIEKR